MKTNILDSVGNEIHIGDVIAQTNFNGEEYEARYKVVGVSAWGDLDCELIAGNEKAMVGKIGLSSITVADGRIRKGVVA